MRLPPGYVGLFLFALVLALSFGGAQVFGDPDTAWHLAAGDLIRSLGHIPNTDSWSYTAQGETWYNLSWLFDVLFSLLFAAGGFSALYVATLLAFTGSFLFMAHHCLKRGASFTSIATVLFLALLLCFTSVLARPNICSLIFTVTFYHLLARYRDIGKITCLYALPPLMALWANMHGGFVLAFPVLVIFLWEALIHKNRSAIKALGITIALCMTATLLNPYGYGVYFGAFKILSATFDRQYLTEWQSAKIGHDIPLTLLLLIMLGVGNLSDKRIPLSDRLLAVAMLLLPLSSMRHSAVAAILTMPYLSLSITYFHQASGVNARIAPIEATIAHDMQKTDVKWIGFIMGVLSIALIVLPFPRNLMLKEPPGFPKENYPIAEAAYIEAHFPHYRFMTDYNLGGYLDYIWQGRVKVFVDGRASSLFSKELLQDYADYAYTSHGYGGRAKLIEAFYKFDGLLIPNDDPGAGDWHWNPDWKLVFQGDVASVYVKADAK